MAVISAIATATSSCCPSLQVQVREIVVSQSEAKKLYCAMLPWLEYDASFVIAWMLLMTTDDRRR